LQQGWFVRIVIGVMMVYSAFILLTLGFFFDRFTEEVWPTLDPLTIVNRYLLAMFVSIFFVLFLFQKTPKVKVVPYLHLPIRWGALVAFFQSTSLLSIHNFLWIDDRVYGHRFHRRNVWNRSTATNF
jgi:hypothetical protein